MRILVYPHDLGMGGSQLNAVELAAGVRDLGHDVVVAGRPGALNARISELGLDFVELPRPGKRPSPTVARALRDLIDARSLDLLHGYEWPPTLEAELAAVGRPRVAVVSTVMSMAVPPFIPSGADLVVGTREIADHEVRRRGRRRVHVVEPPVDLSYNRPDLDLDVAGFRARYALDDDRVTVVAVARFAHELKLEGTLTAIDVAAEEPRMQLVLVGDGPARDEVAARADRANSAAGRRAVVLTGALADPRPAYAAAHISLGMGGSALRALAFGSPLVVQGERGFWRLLTPESLESFLWTGWYGVGEGPESGASRLRGILGPLLGDAARRADLGAYGLQVVRAGFSLEQAAQRQAEIYAAAVQEPPSRAVRRRGDVASLARYSAYYARKRLRRLQGSERADDFNARPVAARNAAAPGRRGA
ncbi:glycosyltransferase [Pseudolysinimonas sp.]|uniref:glycosyltransferase n=1 Tax=Pseudolysinimonas sp. TaxID=2680009 RepID=UPI003F8237D8